MKISNTFKISLCIIFITATTGALAMGLGDFGKVCLFSKMSGVITLDGNPAINAKLVRIVKHKIVDEAVTNESGYFEFPAIFERTITKYLPQEFVVKQEIIAHYQGKQYEMWSGIKRKEGENIESRGKPLIVQCELTSEEKGIVIDGSPIFSLCTWDVEPDPKIIWDANNVFEPENNDSTNSN